MSSSHLKHLFPILGALVLLPVMAGAESARTTVAGPDSGGAMESSYRSIVGLLEAEIAGLEARITVLTTERRREMTRLQEAREETAQAEKRLAQLHREQLRLEEGVRAAAVH